MKLQTKGVLISTNYIKKEDKEFHIVSVLLEDTTKVINIFVKNDTYDRYKNKERFSPLLVNVDINVDTNKIYYSL